jgi:TonB family protein
MRGPQVSAFRAKASDIVYRAIIPAFRERPDHMRGAVKVQFRLDPSGHPSEITVASSTSDQWIQDTATRMIRGIQFPPFSPKLLSEIKQKYVYIVAQWEFSP